MGGFDSQVEDKDEVVAAPVVEPADSGNTDEPKAEESGAKQEPEATPKPVFNAEEAFQQLKEQLTNQGRELGQSRQLQSKYDKLIAQLEGRGSQTKPSQDDVLSKLSPEDLAASRQLVKTLWEQEYGQKFNSLLSLQEQAKVKETSHSFETTARSLAKSDDNYKQLEPIMASYVSFAKQQEQAGDPEAAELIELIKAYPAYGARIVYQKAVEYLAEKQGGQSRQATGAQQNRGARAAGAVPGGASKGGEKLDPSKMSIDELRAAAEKEALEH
jgi:hypothetical protein